MTDACEMFLFGFFSHVHLEYEEESCKVNRTDEMIADNPVSNCQVELVMMLQRLQSCQQSAKKDLLFPQQSLPKFSQTCSS